MTTGYDVRHLAEHSVRPALKILGVYSPEVELLVLGTAAAETRLRFSLDPDRFGPWGMHRSTHQGIWGWLRHREEPWRGKEWAAKPGPGARFEGMMHELAVWTPSEWNDHPYADQMAWNSRYAAAMCTLNYLRQPGFELPEGSTKFLHARLGELWLRYYHPGGDLCWFTENYRALVLEPPPATATWGVGVDSEEG